MGVPPVFINRFIEQRASNCCGIRTIAKEPAQEAVGLCLAGFALASGQGNISAPDSTQTLAQLQDYDPFPLNPGKGP